jgi:voltage-gated potassium channel
VFLITFTFATFYWALSGRSIAAFTEPLSRIDAVYFAVTVFTTTGFGDIRATSDVARFAVTLQMFFGFAFSSEPSG